MNFSSHAIPPVELQRAPLPAASPTAYPIPSECSVSPPQPAPSPQASSPAPAPPEAPHRPRHAQSAKPPRPVSVRFAFPSPAHSSHLCPLPSALFPSSPSPLALSSRLVYTTHVPNATLLPESLPCLRHAPHSRPLAATNDRLFPTPQACSARFIAPCPPRLPNRTPPTLSRPGQESPHPTTCPPHAARAPPRPPQTPEPRQNAPRAASRVFWKKLLRARRRPISRPRHPPPSLVRSPRPPVALPLCAPRNLERPTTGKR